MPTRASSPPTASGVGAPSNLLSKRLKEVGSRLKRVVLDVEVEVAVRLPDTTEYRFYLTNIEPASLEAHALAQTYAARWRIELIFTELKSHYRLQELPTRKAYIVEILLLGAVITLLLGRRFAPPPGRAVAVEGQDVDVGGTPADRPVQRCRATPHRPRRERAPQLTGERHGPADRRESHQTPHRHQHPRLGALEDEVPPTAGRVIVQFVAEIDEMQQWLEGRE